MNNITRDSSKNTGLEIKINSYKQLKDDLEALEVSWFLREIAIIYSLKNQVYSAL